MRKTTYVVVTLGEPPLKKKPYPDSQGFPVIMTNNVLD